MSAPDHPQSSFNSSGDSAAELSGRVQRLEEALGFAEHTSEQLSQEIRELGSRLRDMQKRLDQLERRVGTVDERIDKIGPMVPPGEGDQTSRD